MKKTNRKEKYNVSVENNQLVLVLNSEILLPEDAPVRVTSAQLEELDYRKLYAAYSSKGRKSVTDPRVLFKVTAYGYQCGIYSTRKLEEACKYRVDFMWLLENGKAPDHSTLSWFRTGRCVEAVEDLFYQYAKMQNGYEHDLHYNCETSACVVTEYPTYARHLLGGKYIPYLIFRLNTGFTLPPSKISSTLSASIAFRINANALSVASK